MPTLFNTSHPGLCRALRRSPLWTQVSALLHGSNKTRSARSITNSRTRSGSIGTLGRGWGYGGHFRAIQDFRYLGDKQEV